MFMGCSGHGRYNMLDLKIERDDVNVELLDAQLRAIGGDLFYGLSAQRGGITLYISESVPDDIRKKLMQAARQHDATQMTPEQQAALERQAVITQERSKPILK